MAETSREERVEKALAELHSVVPKDVPCPICGGQEWNVAEGIIASIGVWAGATEGDEDPFAPLPALVLMCRKCRFVRQHYAESPEG